MAITEVKLYNQHNKPAAAVPLAYLDAWISVCHYCLFLEYGVKKTYT